MFAGHCDGAAIGSAVLEPRGDFALVSRQRALIESLWQCLKPGGLMLYTSCSILKQENEDLICGFLESVVNAKYERIAADWGVECQYGRQLLPGATNGPDGFFFSLLRKI